MPLSDIEIHKLNNYLEKHNFTDGRKERIRNIAELSSDGFSFNKICDEVKGCRGDVNEIKTKLRRLGVC